MPLSIDNQIVINSSFLLPSMHPTAIVERKFSLLRPTAFLFSKTTEHALNKSGTILNFKLLSIISIRPVFPVEMLLDEVRIHR